MEVYYVSSSLGDDQNDGLSIQSPFQDPQRRQYPRLSQFLSKYQNLIHMENASNTILSE